MEYKQKDGSYYTPNAIETCSVGMVNNRGNVCTLVVQYKDKENKEDDVLGSLSEDDLSKIRHQLNVFFFNRLSIGGKFSSTVTILKELILLWIPSFSKNEIPSELKIAD